MKKSLVCYLFLSLLLCCLSCREKAPEQQQNKEISEEQQWEQALREDAKTSKSPALALNQQLDVLSDSLGKAWAAVETGDRQELQYVRQLSEQIARVKKHNKTLLDTVKNLLKDAEQKRISDYKKLESARIDAYDQAVTQLVSATNRLYESTPAVLEKCKDCGVLIMNIRDIEKDVILYRNRYDDFARQINELIESRAAELEKLGGKYKELKTLPLFAIGG